MKADEPTQQTLLDVQRHDTLLMQLAYKINTAPERGELEEMDAKCSALRDRVVAAEVTSSKVDGELAKAESDVQQVRDRSARNRQRLDSGTTNAKDAEALTSELESLKNRQARLEDVELEAMERSEAAASALQVLQTDLAQHQATRAQISERLARTVAQLEEERAHVLAERDRHFADLPEQLADLYTDLTSDFGGLVAVPLTGKRCDGCRMELSSSDLGKLAGIARDELLRCPECERILIRTDQSSA